MNSFYRLFRTCLLLFLSTCAMITCGQTHKVEVKIACGFSGEVLQSYVCQDDPPAWLEDKVYNMIAYNGLSGSGIHIEDCRFVSRPVTTQSTEGKISIMVNSATFKKADHWTMTVILAHELAHIYNGDIYGLNDVTADQELKADYYAGFWVHRAKCPDFILVIAAFKGSKTDATHPDSVRRTGKAFDGWQDAEKRYLADGTQTEAERFRASAGVLVTVTPYVLRRFLASRRNDFKVKIHLTSADINVPVDTITNHILKVTYSFDEPHIKEPLVVSVNKFNDNYGYLITGVWNHFPVKCVIYFKDDSILPIVKYFKLDLEP